MSEFASYTDARMHNAIIDPLSRVGQAKFFKPPVVYDFDRLDEDDIHTVSSDAKKIVFHKQLPTQTLQAKVGQRILDRLTRLSPSTATHFRAKTDMIEKMTFRLWAQRETEDMREDAFVALSYCWDQTRHPPQPLVKYPLPVPPLMFQALATERQWRSTGVWVDRLCIDQQNKAEKGVSVAAMDSVYRAAQTVVVALMDIELPLAHQEFLRDYIPEYETYVTELFVSPHRDETPRFFESILC